MQRFLKNIAKQRKFPGAQFIEAQCSSAAIAPSQPPTILLDQIKNFASPLSNRSLIHLRGSDSAKLIQGLITADVYSFQSNHSENQFAALNAVLLNHAGRVTADLLLYKINDSNFILELDESLRQNTLKYFKLHKLRSQVDVLHSSASVWSFPGFDNLQLVHQLIKRGDALVVQDPRFARLGCRAIVPRTGELTLIDALKAHDIPVLPDSFYNFFRLLYGIPESSDKHGDFFGNALPLECNFDYLNAISFNKGCYVGQELTTRTHYQGVIRKRLLPMIFGKSPEQVLDAVAQIQNHTLQSREEQSGRCDFLFPSNDILKIDFQAVTRDQEFRNIEIGKTAAKITSVQGNLGIGMVRLDLGFSQENGESGNVLVNTENSTFAVPWKPVWWPRNTSGNQ